MNDNVARVRALHMSVNIDAAPSDVWRALTEDINSWWPDSFFAGGEPGQRTVVLEAEPGGRMFEQWQQGGLLWGHVVAVDPGKLLQVLGHQFPTWGGPSAWYGTWEMSGNDKQTMLAFSESAVGRLPDDYVDDKTKGWNFLWATLKAHLENREKPVWAD